MRNQVVMHKVIGCKLGGPEVCLVTFLVVGNCPAPNVRPWTGRFHPAGQTSTLVCTFIFLRKDSGTRTGAEANTCKR